MEKIVYTINDELGLHARPAGLLVKEITAFKSDASIATAVKAVDAKRIMGVMGLGIKQGDIVTITFNGEDEKDAAQKIKQFMGENL